MFFCHCIRSTVISKLTNHSIIFQRSIQEFWYSLRCMFGSEKDFWWYETNFSLLSHTLISIPLLINFLNIFHPRKFLFQSLLLINLRENSFAKSSFFCSDSSVFTPFSGFLLPGPFLFQPRPHQTDFSSIFFNFLNLPYFFVIFRWNFKDVWIC